MMELEKKKQKQAEIKMPDGSIIRGPCEDYHVYSNCWVRAVINGIEYRCDQSRFVVWEE